MNDSQALFHDLLDQRRDPLVRTTFTLSAEAVEALRWLQDELDVQPKDIADLIFCERPEFAGVPDASSCIDDILAHATAADSDRARCNQRKNLSLRKPALDALNELTRSHGIARDVFVSHMILHASSCLRDAMAERDRARSVLIESVDRWQESGVSTLRDSLDALPETDSCRQEVEGWLADLGTRVDVLRREFAGADPVPA